MSSTEATQSDEYALVSSFYGPGAVVGWYLTALAYLVSFSLHPRKRNRDSITVDLITVLTFPAFAAADLIMKVRSYPKEGAGSVQNAASVEATLIVTETFLTIDVTLFLLAVVPKCMRRACLLAIVGLFCFSAECYVYFSPFVRKAIEQNHNRRRPFLLVCGDLLSIVIAELLIYVISALGLMALYFLVPLLQPHARQSERDVEATHRDWERDFKQRNYAKVFTIMSAILASSICGQYLSFLEAEMSWPFQDSPWIPTVVSRIAHGLIPRSNISIKELDQAVAFLSGATVLGFTLYSTADAYYQAWLSKTRATTGQLGIELRTLDRNEAPSRRRRTSR